MKKIICTICALITFVSVQAQNKYNNRGEGSATDKRVSWSRQLTKKEAQKITREAVFAIDDTWNP